MFSPGFRLFFGLAVLATVGAIMYGITSDPGGSIDYLGFIDAESWVGAFSMGWSGGIGDHVGYVVLSMFAVTALGLAIMLVAFRDADPDAVAELSGGQLPPAQGPTLPDYWPIIAAFGAGVIIVGLVTNAAIFVVGLLIVFAAGFEWMMACWADRATGDPVANRQLRDRIMKPVEVPVLGAVGIAVLVLAFSRVFLAVSKEWAVWAATAMAAVVFLGAIAMALVEKPNKNLVAGVLSLGAIAALAGGVVSAVAGERDFEHHEEHGEDDHSEEGSESEEGLGR